VGGLSLYFEEVVGMRIMQGSTLWCCLVLQLLLGCAFVLLAMVDEDVVVVVVLCLRAWSEMQASLERKKYV